MTFKNTVLIASSILGIANYAHILPAAESFAQLKAQHIKGIIEEVSKQETRVAEGPKLSELIKNMEGLDCEQARTHLQNASKAQSQLATELKSAHEALDAEYKKINSTEKKS